MDEEKIDRLIEVISAWKEKEPKSPLERINVLLAVVKDEIIAQKKARLLLKISDTQNPPRTRREDIERNLQGLEVEE